MNSSLEKRFAQKSLRRSLLNTFIFRSQRRLAGDLKNIPARTLASTRQKAALGNERVLTRFSTNPDWWVVKGSEPPSRRSTVFLLPVPGVRVKRRFIITEMVHDRAEFLWVIWFHHMLEFRSALTSS